MQTREGISSIEYHELRGIARTVAEIEWLLLVLTLLYQVVEGGSDFTRSAVGMALFVYAAFLLGFHYLNFFRREARWKVAIESWVMIVFITWVLWFTGGLQSPLLNLYLLPVITSALALGKLATLLEVALITACFVLLGGSLVEPVMAVSRATLPIVQLAPMLLVGYLTTMFSADIRYGLNKAKMLSESDELTELYNMRGFSMVMDRAFAQAVRYSRPLSVLMIDSDNLKAVNDQYGHEAGNDLLRQLAASIKAHLRTTDVPARYGGDEFVVLLPDTEADAARDVAERIRESIVRRPLELRHDSVLITVSIGFACYPADGRSAEILLERADQAMYRAKEQGRNRVVRFSVPETKL